MSHEPKNIVAAVPFDHLGQTEQGVLVDLVIVLADHANEISFIQRFLCSRNNCAVTEFVKKLLSELGTFPTYYQWLPELNRHDLDATPQLPLRPLSVDDVRRLLAVGAEVVDVRSVASYAAGHVPGSLSNMLRPAFGSWLGWLTTRDRALVFVCDADTDRAELLRQCANIGYDNIAGEMRSPVRC